MPASPITDDYYVVLEVGPTATLEQIVRSYKRLALKLHPDRNIDQGATKAFQLLGQAYETLKDESSRRAYDLIYPSIARSSQRPPSAQTPRSEALSEEAQINVLRISKQERAALWWTKKNTFDSTIFELQRQIRRLEQEINNLDSIAAAEAAMRARENSWGTWLLSPIYKKPKESEEEKALKDRGRQERRIEKDMKERRLESQRTDLKNEEKLLMKAKADVDAADLDDDRKIGMLHNQIQRKKFQEDRERERVERERIEQIRKQQEEQRMNWERETAEALRKEQAKRRAAEQIRSEEALRKWQDDQAKRSRTPYTDSYFAEGSTGQTYTSSCRHDGWWPKVQGRTACPQCNETWTYLLQCPSCNMKACPKCQAAVRPRRPRCATRTNRRAPPRVRTPSPYLGNDNYW